MAFDHAGRYAASRRGDIATADPAYVSTAGLKSQKTGHGLWEESHKILDGRINDPTTLVVNSAAAEDADWKNEDAWRVANPSLGFCQQWRFCAEKSPRP